MFTFKQYMSFWNGGGVFDNFSTPLGFKLTPHVNKNFTVEIKLLLLLCISGTNSEIIPKMTKSKRQKLLAKFTTWYYGRFSMSIFD